MGKVDVISSIFESFELIREHYKEVAVPLLVLILLSGIGHFGGSSFSNNYGQNGAEPFEGAGLANAMMGDNGGVLALGGFLLLLIAAVILMFLAVMVISEATTFYIYEHFYAILNKKKIKAKWTERFGRLAGKSIVLILFRLAIFAAVFMLPLLQFWNIVSTLEAMSVAGIIGALFSIAFALVAGIVMFVIVSFALTPLWVYYVMDGKGLFDSAGKSVNLVVGNPASFMLMAFVFGLLGIGMACTIMISTCCCLSWLVSPILSVGFSMLYGVTLMKVKLAIEK
ncbi:MAG: hypothetical protein WCT52_02030 [Candidatus Micrarchaeia archaeon]